MKFDTADIVGLLGAALTCAGVWSLWGWAWASLSLGAPLLVIYLYAELRRASQIREG